MKHFQDGDETEKGQKNAGDGLFLERRQNLFRMCLARAPARAPWALDKGVLCQSMSPPSIWQGQCTLECA